jgi:predicted phage terminase large subunit-like protein
MESQSTEDLEAEIASLASEAREDLLFYAQICNSSYIPSRTGFHALLASKLQALGDGNIKRLVVSTPPRHGKSQLTSVEFTTWLLGRFPKKKIVLASYAQSLALEMSKQARARMASEEYQEVFSTRIAEGDAAAHEWKTSEGGMFKAVGVGGGLTGRGADVLICDDLFRDFQDAHSSTMRERVWNWFWSVAYTRLHPGAVVVIIMTRWHRDDIVGRLLDPERLKSQDRSDADAQWEYLNLPALAESDDPLGRKPGEALFPERYPESALASIRTSVGSYVWASLYTGNPVVRGGNYIRVDKFQIVDEAPEGIRWVRFWDLATDAKSQLDHTAGAAVGFGDDGTLYIRDVMDGQWTWPDARQRIKLVAEAERFPVGVEAVGGFKTAFQNLLEVMPPYVQCHEFGVDRDKFLRAQAWTAMVANGKVALVRGSWNMDFIMQAEAFPSGKNDDMIDAVSGGYTMLQSASVMGMVVKSSGDKFRSAMRMRRERSLIG